MGSALRMAKYSVTPVSYFLELPISDFCRWIEVINAEIKAENKRAKASRKK